jgi:hemoglobin/transferrin/lactoferrin receptor protein
LANKEIMQHGQYNFGKEKLSFAGGITYSDFSDLKMGKHGPDDYLRKEYIKRINNEDISKQNSDSRKQVHTAYSQLNLLQKIRLKTSDKSEILYNFQYSETSNIPRYDRLIQYSGDQLKYAQWYYGPQKLQFHSLQYENKKEIAFYNDVRFNASYQKYQESRHSRKVNSNSLKNRTENLDIFTINLDANKEFTKNTQLYYGSEYTHNSLDSKGFNRDIITKEKTDISSRYPDDSKYSSLAFYTKMTWKINKKLSLNSGLRYSHIWINSNLDNTFYDFPFESLDLSTGALNGGVGITYQTVNKWLIKVNSTTGFRAPNIDDIGKVFDSEPGKVVVPNNNLKAEYIYNFETNISKNFNDIIHIDFGLFYSFLDNAMVRKDYTFDNEDTIIYDGVESQVQAIVNADQAKVWGSHITAIVKMSDQFSLQSNLSFTKGEYKDGSPLRHAPPLFGNANLTYKRGQFTSKLLFEYNGKISYKNLANTEKDKAYLYAKDKNGNPYSPAWAILSLQNRFKLTKHLNASVDVENILNKRYRAYSSGICGAGRSFNLGFSLTL